MGNEWNAMTTKSPAAIVEDFGIIHFGYIIAAMNR
jgi:hypothetical protein